MPLNKPINNWLGQRVWIVGGSSGIGAALAREFLAQGAKVIVSARRAELLQEVAHGRVSAYTVAFDATDQKSWQEAYEQIQSQLGGIDLLVFCVAEYRVERIWEVDAEKASRTLDTNLGSMYKSLSTVLPSMIAKESGGIAVIASVAGFFGLPNASVYGPTKAALINLSEILYTDLHPKGINVYLINPGFVDTPLTKKNPFHMPALQTSQQAALRIVRGISQGKFEIHFPYRFTFLMKFVQLLPYRLRFILLNCLIA